jgi:hypothetical protein
MPCFDDDYITILDNSFGIHVPKRFFWLVYSSLRRKQSIEWGLVLDMILYLARLEALKQAKQWICKDLHNYVGPQMNKGCRFNAEHTILFLGPHY